MPDDEPFPERLGDAVAAYLARCRMPYVWTGAAYDPAANEERFAHLRAREAAIEQEYRRRWVNGDWAPARYACCTMITEGQMGGGKAQIHAHVASFKHVAAVFDVDEATLRAAVLAERKRGAL